MKKTASLLALLAVAGLMMVTAPEQVDARPKYIKVFAQKFEEVKDQVDQKKGTKKCGVCHGKEGKNKKQLSNFAMELKKALGKKNEGNLDKIGEALDAVAKENFDGDKTYGDLLKAGKLPPPYKEKEEE